MQRHKIRRIPLPHIFVDKFDIIYLFEDEGKPPVDNKTDKHSELLQNTIGVIRPELVENNEVVGNKIMFHMLYFPKEQGGR